jgi:phosphate:Na+ symporter
VTLLAAYHTAYNVVGVAVLLPATEWFTRVVERLLPSKESSLKRSLDRAALANPVVAVEAVRRAVAHVLATLGAAIEASLAGKPSGGASAADATSALDEAREFLSELKLSPSNHEEHLCLTNTVHALDHAARLAEMLNEDGAVGSGKGGVDDLRAAKPCAEAMRGATTVAEGIASESALSGRAEPIGWKASPEAKTALAALESAAKELDVLQRGHRASTLAAVAPGRLTATDAFARVDAARRMDEMAHHAWRSASHLLGALSAQEETERRRP